MKHPQTTVLLRLYSVITLLILLLYLLLPKPAFSERENRALAASPFSLRDPKGALSLYMRDRFPLRSLFVGIPSELESRLFSESGGVLRVGDRLIAREDSFDLSRFRQKLNEVHALKEELGIPLTVVLVPRPSDHLGDRLPLYRSPSADDVLSAVKAQESIALAEALTLADYYKTDHHLNEHGVEKLCRLLFESLGATVPTPIRKTRLSDFRGSAFRQSGLLFFRSEELALPHFEKEDSLCVSDQKREALPYYDERFFSFGDRYSAFFGGNRPYLSIESKKEARERVLVIRDSYASPVLPYLASVYDVTAVDPRSFRGDLAAVARACGARRILLLSGVSLLTDKGFLLYFEESKDGSTVG